MLNESQVSVPLERRSAQWKPLRRAAVTSGWGTNAQSLESWQSLARRFSSLALGSGSRGQSSAPIVLLGCPRVCAEKAGIIDKIRRSGQTSWPSAEESKLFVGDT